MRTADRQHRAKYEFLIVRSLGRLSECAEQSYCGAASLPTCNQNTMQRMRDTRAALITFVSREVHSERCREQRIIVPQIPQSRWFLLKNRKWNIP
jgi:hypothetical protein